MTDRLCSAGILPRVSSAGSLDPPSDESVESLGRLQMRASPIPNVNERKNNAKNSLLVNNNNNNSGRRLSIKQDQLSIDSIC